MPISYFSAFSQHTRTHGDSIVVYGSSCVLVCVCVCARVRSQASSFLSLLYSCAHITLTWFKRRQIGNARRCGREEGADCVRVCTGDHTEHVYLRSPLSLFFLRCRLTLSSRFHVTSKCRGLHHARHSPLSIYMRADRLKRQHSSLDGTAEPVNPVAADKTRSRRVCFHAAAPHRETGTGPTRPRRPRGVRA